MATMINIICNDFVEDAALYISISNLLLIVERNKSGYNSNATNINKKLMVSDEKKNAVLYFFLLAKRGKLATLKKVSNGKINKYGFFLKSFAKCVTNNNV